MEHRPLEPRINEQLMRTFPEATDGFLRVGPNRVLMPAAYREFSERLTNFRFREEDVCVCSMPRSGTTLMMELVWLVANDMDFEMAKSRPLIDRFSFLEFNVVVGEKYRSNLDDRFSKSVIDFLDSLASPRFINTHLPFELIPDILKSNCKIIYMIRDPKDTAVSWYNFSKSNKTVNFQGDLSQFCDYLTRDLLIWSPYWEHVKQAWSHRHRPNLLVLFYEEVVKDIPGTVKRVSDFLCKKYSDEEVARLARHMSFSEFRANPMVNVPYPRGMAAIEPENYIRRGKAGGWRDALDPETLSKLRQWTLENTRDSDLEFLNF